MYWAVAGAAIALLVLTGCEKSDFPSPGGTSTPPNVNTSLNTIHLNQAQPKLPTIKLWLGPRELTGELAATPVQIATGMMFRKEMAEEEGMLFIFPRPERRSFYMKNTVIPLSCAYIDPEGTVIETHNMKPLDESPIWSTSDNIQYVLEVRQGWFERHNIQPGTLVRTDRGSFRETFFGRRD